MITNCYSLSISQLLDKALDYSREREVVYDGTKRYTYQNLWDDANKLAAGLQKKGIKKGDRIGVTLPAWYEFIVAVFAIAKLGAILVPFNTRFREDEVEHILKDSGAKAVLFPENYDDIDHLSKFQSIKGKVTSLELLVTVRFEAKGVISYTQLLQEGSKTKVQEAKINVTEDIYAIIYTSGTTGKPKGAMLTHYNLMFSAVKSSIASKITKDDVFLQASPFFHIMGLGAILRLVGNEAKAVILEKYSPERTLQLVEQEGITIHPGVPTFFILQLNHPKFHSYDLSSIRLAIPAGAQCPVEVLKRIKREMGCQIMTSYGMTETAPMLTVTSLDDDETLQSETVGRAIDGVELKIVDENRQEVSNGQVGEIAARTPGLMKGYYNSPEKTAEVVDEFGWFYTGDLGTIDDEGYVRIVGRKKDMIIRGGYNIYPNEVEEIFYTHPAVSEVAVVGLPDTVLGEVSCALVTLKEKHAVTSEKLKEFISGQVADYKTPDHIMVVEDLPKTPSGKIMKFIIRDSIMKEKAVPLR